MSDLWQGRSHLQEASPGLLIANFFGAKNKQKLLDAKITHIVVCACELPKAHKKKLFYLKLNVRSFDTMAVHLLGFVSSSAP